MFCIFASFGESSDVTIFLSLFIFKMENENRKKIERRKTIALVIIIVIGLSALSYVAQERFKSQDNQENIEFYQSGVHDAITQIFQMAVNCEQISMTFPVFNNQTNQTQDVTITLIAGECLNGN